MARLSLLTRASNIADSLKTKKFNNIIDKGLIDGLYLGGEPGSLKISSVISSCFSVLEPKIGVLAFCSFSPPKYILPYLGKGVENRWRIGCREIGEPVIYFYEMKIKEKKGRMTKRERHEDRVGRRRGRK